MSYYRVCSNCGCSLDPGEKCDCIELEERKRKKQEEFFNRSLTESKTGQVMMAFVFENREVTARDEKKN